MRSPGHHHEAHKKYLRAVAYVFYLADAKELLKEALTAGHMVRDQPVDQEFLNLMKSKAPGRLPPQPRNGLAWPSCLAERSRFTRGVTPGTLKALKA